jgi:cyclophilin family peptidyl-prolyl cis-trans isomerase
MTTKKREKRNKKITTKSAKTGTKTPAATIKKTHTAMPETTQLIVQKTPTASAKKSAITWNNPLKRFKLDEGGKGDRYLATAASIALIAASVWIAVGYIPQIYKLTSLGGVEELDQKAGERKQDKLAEDSRIAQVNKAVMKTSMGDIKLDLFRADAPVTTDNFLRLSDRKKYDGNMFHRMVQTDSFAVLQGGDYEKNNGQGGAGALTATIQDEVWKVFPEFGDNGQLVNQPQFNVPSAYSGYAVLGKSQDGSSVQQQVTIKKGYLAMAKTSAPNSAGSQFFYTLADTTLPADYTVFAKVSDESLSVLDKIASEVNPVDSSGAKSIDGKPSKEIKITSIELIK